MHCARHTTVNFTNPCAHRGLHLFCVFAKSGPSPDMFLTTPVPKPCSQLACVVLVFKGNGREGV